MPVLPAETAPRLSSSSPSSSRWRLRDRRTIALVAAGVVLVALGVVWIVRAAGSDEPATQTAAPPIQAQQQSPVRKSGLDVSRAATGSRSAGRPG